MKPFLGALLGGGLALVAVHGKAVIGPPPKPLAAAHTAARSRTIPVDADHVPVIARILGVRVGYDTIERLESLYGEGLAYTGGHPQGARQWKCRRTGWYVNTDGFNFRAGGRVIDFIDISNDGIIHSRPTPHISVSPRRARFMGVVALGMSHAEVRRLLRDLLPPPDVDEDGDFSWTAKTHVRINQHQTDDKDEWDANLLFEKDRLVCIEICT